MIRTQVNQAIQAYWLQCKKTLGFTPISKPRIPSFTRPNGHKIRRLRDSGWRYPKSSQGNGPRMKKPSIGYRNPQSIRYALKAYGLKPQVIRNPRELDLAWGRGLLPVIAHQVGARKRIVLLDHAKTHGIPLILRR